MSEAQAADSRAHRPNLIALSLLLRYPLCQGMLSGRCAPENGRVHPRAKRVGCNTGLGSAMMQREGMHPNPSTKSRRGSESPQ